MFNENDADITLARDPEKSEAWRLWVKPLHGVDMPYFSRFVDALNHYVFEVLWFVPNQQPSLQEQPSINLFFDGIYFDLSIDPAKVGSNAVVTKPVPAGATAVGNPARIIQIDADAKREEVASKMGFSAYGVTQNDDPVSQAMRGLIDNAASQEHQIALLWQAIEQLSKGTASDCVPSDAAKKEHFEAARINQLLD